MTDKYEEFKEWWSRKGFTTNPFIEFEEEQAKKEKEKEIKKVLDKYIVKIGFGSIGGGDIEINADAVVKCYNELKEKDLLK